MGEFFEFVRLFAPGYLLCLPCYWSESCGNRSRAVAAAYTGYIQNGGCHLYNLLQII